MVKKLDLGKVKAYLFFKGERIGLGLAVVVAVLFLAYGVLTASKSSPPPNTATWQEALAKAAKGLDDRIAAAPAAPKGEPIKNERDWDPFHDFAAVGPWFSYASAEITKRKNPDVVAIEHIKADYVRAGVLTYDLRPDAKDPKVGILLSAAGGPGTKPGVGVPPAFNMGPRGGAGGSGQGEENLVRIMRPKRMVVVNAVFPMHEQYERFREALRLPTMAELLNNKELAPRFLGFDVVRREILSNNERGAPEFLYQYDPKKGKMLVVSKKIDLLFREAIFDEDNVKKYLYHLYPTPLTPSLATPLPKLALGQYPPADLPGITEVPGGVDDLQAPMKPMGVQPPMGGIVMPGKKGPMDVPNPGNMAAAVEGKFGWLSWSKLSQVLHEKFKGNYYPVDPLGNPPEGFADDKKGLVRGLGDGKGMPPGMPPPGVGLPRPGEKDNLATATLEKIPDALIRFLDVDVEVGKSYEYSLQVWLANPNYGKKNEVTHAALAEVKELRSPSWVSAKLPGRVPEEHFFYVVDQQDVVSKVPRGSDLKPAEKEKDKAPVQIHTWVTSFKDRLAGNKERVIGDWAIAERILLRRGEFLGRNEFMVEVPEWEPLQGGFVLGSSTPFVKAVKGKKDAAINTAQATGIPVDFIVSPLPRVPLVVDFEGGKRTHFYVGRTLVNDESAFDVLILDANGKLIVRNSRDDADRDNPEAAERQRRYEVWSQRVHELHQHTQPGGLLQLPGGHGQHKGN